ncbi:MAG: NAD(P)H-quinone oxidoreductase [Candidatus Binatus sp.]|uniref:NAD(P)H-quinone oxidoreductase n=1 Tax=Candidatus Binatus sp. TaxID=2811406 RepID=UPI00271C1B66|nr:NAD(P)H-quinone oxidoreductase [Candidatus Binatus sp.]MDO8433535.1 NAD(P)H-quinone oxidoreductase [Candidatus Binatus sp.]
MKAVIAEKPGDENVLKLAEVAEPALKPDEIMIRVRAAGLNRADILQRQGFYPPPPGASEIIGLECAGDVAAIGASVSGWKVGDRAMALLPGGGYAEKAAAHHGSAMKIPSSMSFAEAAGLPEVFLTAFLNLFMLAGLKDGETSLIHGGGSGVGTASILLIKEAGLRSIVTAGSDGKCEQCLKLGADIAINYKNGPFAAAVKTATGGRGVDVILDSIGGAYLAGNIEALAHGGRLVLIGLMSGARAEIDLAAVLRRHLKIFGSTLRTRPAAEKAEIIAAFVARFGAALEAGRLRPPIYKVLPASEAATAHRMMQASEHFGKIILSFD